jgi:hypothetical protein
MPRYGIYVHALVGAHHGYYVHSPSRVWRMWSALEASMGIHDVCTFSNTGIEVYDGHPVPMPKVP